MYRNVSMITMLLPKNVFKLHWQRNFFSHRVTRDPFVTYVEWQTHTSLQILFLIIYIIHIVKIHASEFVHSKKKTVSRFFLFNFNLCSPQFRLKISKYCIKSKSNSISYWWVKIKLVLINHIQTKNRFIHHHHPSTIYPASAKIRRVKQRNVATQADIQITGLFRGTRT